MFLFAQYNPEKCIIILAMVALSEVSRGFTFSMHYSKKYIRKYTFPMIGAFLCVFVQEVIYAECFLIDSVL